jgi:hypothetical protein
MGRLLGRRGRSVNAHGDPTGQLQDAAMVVGYAAADVGSLGLPQVFFPAAAAAVLRNAGLTELTECALRARAYRRQVPFHRNGRRIVFTLGDLREIATGEPHAAGHRAQATAAARPTHRPLLPRNPTTTADCWRARRPRSRGVRVEHPPHAPRSAAGTGKCREAAAVFPHGAQAVSRTADSPRMRRAHGDGA